ncbi:peptide-methionine (S)-S-oxide reductase MsrA [Oenococcus oeni]|nr:peptide-methionine (S)-S-oxide reductase MsrA [Oenococcus oeni]
MMTKNNCEEILNDIYNLILNPATSAWERSLLSSAKNAIGEDMNFERQLSKLEFEL